MGEREGLLTAKFAILLIWVLLLTLVTWGGVLVLSSIYHRFFDLAGYSLLVAGEWLIRFLFGNLMIFLTLPVFAYIGIKAKGFVAPVMASSVIVMGGTLLTFRHFKREDIR